MDLHGLCEHRHAGLILGGVEDAKNRARVRKHVPRPWTSQNHFIHSLPADLPSRFGTGEGGTRSPSYSRDPSELPLVVGGAAEDGDWRA